MLFRTFIYFVIFIYISDVFFKKSLAVTCGWSKNSNVNTIWHDLCPHMPPTKCHASSLHECVYLNLNVSTTNVCKLNECIWMVPPHLKMTLYAHSSHAVIIHHYFCECISVFFFFFTIWISKVTKAEWDFLFIIRWLLKNLNVVISFV